MKNLYYIMSRANYNQHDVMYMLSNAEVIYKVNTLLSEEQLEKAKPDVLKDPDPHNAADYSNSDAQAPAFRRRVHPLTF